MTTKDATGDEQTLAAQLDDARSVVVYLVVKESAQYIAIMDVLEASITDLTPDQVEARLQAASNPVDRVRPANPVFRRHAGLVRLGGCMRIGFIGSDCCASSAGAD